MRDFTRKTIHSSNSRDEEKLKGFWADLKGPIGGAVNQWGMDEKPTISAAIVTESALA